MKRFILLGAVVICSMASFAQASADNILKEASQVAATQHKKVFVLFHASWCGWCHRMDSIMANADCKQLFDDNFVIRHITVMENDKHKKLENPGGKELVNKYGGEGKGIPYWLIFDADGKLVEDCLMDNGENSGCPATKEEVDYFVEVLRKTTKLKEEQLAVVSKNFIKK